MDLILRHVIRGNSAIVTVGGEIDLATGPEFKGYLRDLIDNGARRLVLDLDLVSFFDSTGLAVLISVGKRLSIYDGSVALVCCQDQILKVLRITGLDKLFPAFPSIADALGERVVTIPEQQVRVGSGASDS